ncbi:hypothetical protein [Streptomyces nodosus]|uniref:hypothetical protein n=1 Tax=Streptomyces nodosus TaxID=40318 RepID=UPI00382282D5
MSRPGAPVPGQASSVGPSPVPPRPEQPPTAGGLPRQGGLAGRPSADREGSSERLLPPHPERSQEGRSGSFGPPPPMASARFPDAPPTGDGAAPSGVPVPADGIVETTARLRQPYDETGAVRPSVTLARPDTRDIDTLRPRGLGGHPPRAAAAAACLVLGLGLMGGAVTGSWLTGDDPQDEARGPFAVASSAWHNLPVDQLFPAAVDGPEAGPGGAHRSWTRIAVAPDGDCKDAFDPLLHKALAPAGCQRLLRATYTDATGSHVITVGLLFTRADAAGMAALNSRFTKEGLDQRTDLMPRPYAARGTVAEGFGDAQRASWTLTVRTDMPVVVYAVSGFADGRTVTEPLPAEKAMESGATSAPAQAGLGHDAVGLADRIGTALRKSVTPAAGKTERSS